MTKYDFLIIGADAAGLSAAVQIRSNLKEASIGVLEKSRIISYGACGLPYVIEGVVEDFKNLIHYSPEKFASTWKCDVFTETEATAVSFAEKSVTVNSPSGSRQLQYEKLLIATGASPVRLPVFNYNSPRVFELKTIMDGDKIRQKLNEENTAHITIIGSGYIGVELAEALVAIGKKVTIIDLAERPVDRMPSKLGKKVKSLMAEHGIEFLPGAMVSEVKEHAGGLELLIAGGSIHTNVVVTAVGIRPATSFLKDSELLMDKGAIVTDKTGKTSIPDVYAAGDCATVYHLLHDKNIYMPLGSTANKQGRIAGLNMAGIKAEFPGIIGTRIFKFFSYVFAATGFSEEDAETAGYESQTISAVRNSRAGYYPGGDKVDVNLVIDKKTGTILGGYLYGPLESAAMIDTIGVMAQMKMTATEAGWFDAAYAPPFAPVWSAVISAAGKFYLTD